MDYELELSDFSLSKTLCCGQCFRWKEEGGAYRGVVAGREITAKQTERGVLLRAVDERDIPLLRRYFDADADYGAYVRRFSSDAALKRACEASAGIRILRQEPFETLISFIISQNNNIPRISGIISRLCESFGEQLPGGGYSFPTASRLRGAEAEDFAPLRAGFRARYIADAVRRVNGGEVCFEEIDALPLDEARERLKLITGVGDKVADCVLLYGFHKLDAFPKDVWIKRMMAEYYPQGLPDCVGELRGVAQQFLFDYIRNVQGAEVKSSAK